MTLTEKALRLRHIPRSWPHRRWEATERLLAEMAARIEELERQVKKDC